MAVIRRKLKAVSDGDRQMVSILTELRSRRWDRRSRSRL